MTSALLGADPIGSDQLGGVDVPLAVIALHHRDAGVLAYEADGHRAVAVVAGLHHRAVEGIGDRGIEGRALLLGALLVPGDARLGGRAAHATPGGGVQGQRAGALGVPGGGGLDELEGLVPRGGEVLLGDGLALGPLSLGRTPHSRDRSQRGRDQNGIERYHCPSSPRVIGTSTGCSSRLSEMVPSSAGSAWTIEASSWSNTPGSSI